MRFGEYHIRYDLTEIKQLEMERHVRRYIDQFRLGLLLDNGQRLYLSAKDLGFSECQDFAEKIRNFLGSEIPIKAID